jgi:hypothetical protein
LFAASTGTAQRLFAVEPGGKPEEIDNKGLYWPLMNPLSPDGSRAALVDPKTGLLMTLTLESGEVEPVKGALAGEQLVRWGADRKLYVARADEAPLVVTRVDLASGARAPWKSLLPEDSAGVYSVATAVITPDAKAWAYTYVRRLDTLYLAEGFS